MGDDWTIVERFCDAAAITRGPAHHYFGYYEKRQFDPTGRYLLGLECDFAGRFALPSDTAAVGMVDRQDGNRWINLGGTRTFSWQMGAMAEWLPGSRDTIIYNDRRDGRFMSVVQNVFSGETRVLPHPVFELAPDGRHALLVNFARLSDVRPETGYVGAADPCGHMAAPDDDGVFRMNLESGRSQLIISHADMADYRNAGDASNGRYYFTHMKFNPTGLRFTFWYRRAPAGASLLFTANADGSDIHYLARDNSHVAWMGSDNVLAWLGGEQPGFYLLADKTQRAKAVAPEVLRHNGHFSFSPDGRWLLTDHPPAGANHERALALCSLDRRVYIDIGRFHSLAELSERQALRCDLHPRWSPDGSWVCFDSTHTGTRQMHLVDVREITSP